MLLLDLRDHPEIEVPGDFALKHLAVGDHVMLYSVGTDTCRELAEAIDPRRELRGGAKHTTPRNAFLKVRVHVRITEAAWGQFKGVVDGVDEMARCNIQPGATIPFRTYHVAAVY